MAVFLRAWWNEGYVEQVFLLCCTEYSGRIKITFFLMRKGEAEKIRKQLLQ